MMVDRKLTREEFRALMKDPKWHRINSRTDCPTEPGAYPVLLNQYKSLDTCWIRDGYKWTGCRWKPRRATCSPKATRPWTSRAWTPPGASASGPS